MSNARVQILMSTYNGESYVGQQIESILLQDHRDWELIISDDHSLDDTYAIVESYAKKDGRIRLLPLAGENVGASRNFMKLLQIADAPYVAFCDQDDVWLPNKLSCSLERIKELEKQGRAGQPYMVFCDSIVVDGSLNPIARSEFELTKVDPTRTNLRQLIARNIVPGCVQLLNKPLVDLAVMAGDSKDIYAHDGWTAWVAAAFGGIGFTKEQLMLYRRHGENVTDVRKYSPISNLNPNVFKQKSQGWIKEYRLEVVQCREFLKTYSDLLDDRERIAVQEFVKSGEAPSFVHAFKHLRNSGCWMAGERKMIQLIALLAR